MWTSIEWLNSLLEPAGLSADEAEHALTHLGFPIESREERSGDDLLDVELTSNRGDCLCHLGLAREIAAGTARRLKRPYGKGFRTSPAAAASVAGVENLVPEGCPRFTARVIRGVRVGPSPKWLVQRLERIGQRSISNVVDVSNYVLAELGHPSHTFDLNTIAGRRLFVRSARPDEPFVALDGRKHALRPGELVVADADRAVSLAGIIGGLDTGVTASTTDILLEVATWDPVTIRRAARRLDIRTDASHRFERSVDARDLLMAQDRLCELIVEVAGGEVLAGTIEAGPALPPARVIDLRASRCWDLLGIEVAPEQMARLLGAVGVSAEVSGGGRSAVLRCTVPNHRARDLEREVDLIEEVARLNGFEKLREAPSIDIRLDFRHPEQWLARERVTEDVGSVLTGMGFFETVTFSFVTEAHAAAFLPPGLRAVKVDEARRKDAPYLRPSLVPSLLICRRANQDGRVAPGPDGVVRLFEFASIFAERDDGARHTRQTVEARRIGMLIDASDAQAGVRALRGAIDAAARAAGGPDVHVGAAPLEAAPPIFKPGRVSAVTIGGRACGFVGALGLGELAPWGLDAPVAVAEVDLDALISLYPPKARAHALPAFPAIERDISWVVDEPTPWAGLHAAVAGAKLDRCEAVQFVGVYRGKPLPPGRKSVTLRLRFRDAARTLRHEEVDPQMAAATAALKAAVGGELRI
ncbi:MAG: phenylalanine--tRNA ligase subunit beta [Phycisphaerales bacterium]|nr:phenylalanine--tRNA ligase subunit beta [Phycisphaerales bacterium]